MVFGCLSSLAVFGWAVIYLVVIWPFTVLIAFFRMLSTLGGFFFVLVILGVIGGVGYGFSQYQPTIMANVDKIFRCYISPVVQGTVVQLLQLVELGYNPSICIWNAINWFVYGYFTQVLVPVFMQCGVKGLLVDVGCILTQLFDSLLVYLATGEFLTGFYDMSKLSASIVQFVDDWIAVACCTCIDTCCLVFVIPFVIPGLPLPLGLVIPALFTQYDFWQSIESGINFVAAMLQVLYPLIIDLLLLQPPSKVCVYMLWWKSVV